MLALSLLIAGLLTDSQVTADEPNFPPVPDASIPRYTAHATEKPLTIDGQLDEAIWDRLPWSRPFVDLISGEPAMHRTQVAVTWDSQCLYLGYRIEEPNVQANFTERDSLIWQENDVEFFVAGEDAYYEFEINARGTIYEGLFVWQERYESSGLANDPLLDRRHPEVKWQEFNGVGLSDHPRGKRLAFLGWDFPQARTAVAVDGTLNDASDVDAGWTVELAFPWEGMKSLNRTSPVALPPVEGDQWRMDFSRFNTYKAPAPANDSGGWAWSQHGVWDSHIPECFTYITFSTSPPSTSESETNSSNGGSSNGGSSATDDLDQRIAAALERAGENRTELERALSEIAVEQRAGMRYLIAYMPAKDLASLKADFLLEHVEYAYRARNSSDWAKQVPEEIFLDSVLPYASINERRDAWRKEFYDRFLPMVADKQSATAAATQLNREIFGLLDVRYSTQRPKADQSPFESIEAKLASCTGLSVLLIDACRSVGVPARLVGTPLWSDMSGNHSWVEVWDDGWHFTGAAEASGENLDQAWFLDRASKAIPGDPRHAIFATSWKERPITFPLVWTRRADPVWGIDVTSRYTEQVEPLAAGMARVRLVAREFDADESERVKVLVVVRDKAGEEVFRGETRDERFDANDHLTSRLSLGFEGTIEIGADEVLARVPLLVERDEQLIEITVPKK